MHHQMVVMASAGMVRFGSLRKGIGSLPAAWRILAISPASGVRMKPQIRVTMVTESTDEEKKMPRKTAAARGARLSARAKASDRMVSGGAVSKGSLDGVVTPLPKN